MSAMSLAKYALLGIVGGLYGIACSLPAAYFDEGGHVCTGVRLGSPTGFEALLSGWFPPFTICMDTQIPKRSGQRIATRVRRSALTPCCPASPLNQELR